MPFLTPMDQLLIKVGLKTAPPPIVPITSTAIAPKTTAPTPVRSSVGLTGTTPAPKTNTTTPAPTTTFVSPLANQPKGFYGEPVGIGTLTGTGFKPITPTIVVPESVLKAGTQGNVSGTATLQQLTSTSNLSKTMQNLNALPSPSKPSGMSLSAFRTKLESQLSDITTQREMFATAPEGSIFTQNGKTVSKSEGLSQLEKEQLNISNIISQTGEYYPGTTVSETATGFKFNFPFAGAEKYKTYKSLLEDNPGQAAALGWGWGGLGNIDIAYYKLTGQNEKAIQRQIEQLAGYAGAKETLASGNVLEFSKQYWSGWFSSPGTQLGISYGVGAGVDLAILI
jgi:hypothetical protein